MRLCRAGLVLALMVSAPETVNAQEVRPTWLWAVFNDRDFFAGESAGWSDWWAVRGLVQRRVGPATLGIELATVHRFDLQDESLAAEVYLELWSGAYAHVRGGVTPEARTLPLSEWNLELFHALAGGWEASGDFALMNHPGSDVRRVGLGIARYVGQWYVRGRATVTDHAGDRAGMGALFARRFLRDSREYVELAGGLGNETIVSGPGPILDTRQASFAALTAQRFVSDHLGVHLSTSLNHFEGIPRRWHVTAGLLARF